MNLLKLMVNWNGNKISKCGMFSTGGMCIDRFHAWGGYAGLRLLVCSRQVRRIDSSTWQWVNGHIGC